MTKALIFTLEWIGSCFVLWLGLYVITRDLPLNSGRLRFAYRSGLVAGFAICLVAIFLLGVAMQTIAHSPEEFILWQRFGWWAAPIAVALFLRAIVLLIYQDETHLSLPRHVETAVHFILGLALLVTLGIIFGVFVDNSMIKHVDSSFASYQTAPRLPYYLLYLLFIIGVLLLIVWLALRKSLQIRTSQLAGFERIRWVAYGSLLSLVGAVIGVIVQPLSQGTIPVQFGMFIIMMGVGTMGYGVVNHNRHYTDLN